MPPAPPARCGRPRSGMRQRVPAGSYQIEAVNIAEWRLNYLARANSPRLPAAEQTISTARVTLPASMPTEVPNADQTRVRPEHPHLPLVFMTVLTQLAAGAFCGVGLPAWVGRRPHWDVASLA